jgi:hypothetical protein
MLEGGSDISATDPFATEDDHYIYLRALHDHVAVRCQIDGFSRRPRRRGTWIMWAGTPYAHLMINQTP